MFLGTEKLVEFGGDVERLYMSQGAEGDFGSREGAFRARKIQGSEFSAVSKTMQVKGKTYSNSSRTFHLKDFLASSSHI